MVQRRQDDRPGREDDTKSDFVRPDRVTTARPHLPRPSDTEPEPGPMARRPRHRRTEEATFDDFKARWWPAPETTD